MDHSSRPRGAEIDDLTTPDMIEVERIFRKLQMAANPGEDYPEVAARIETEAARYRDFLREPGAIGKVVLNVKQMGSDRADCGTVHEQYHVTEPSEGKLDPIEGRASVCYTFNRSNNKVLEFVVYDEQGNPLFPIARAYANWVGEREFDLGRNRKFYLNMCEDEPGYVKVHSGFVPFIADCALSRRREPKSPRAVARRRLWPQWILSGLTLPRPLEFAGAILIGFAALVAAAVGVVPSNAFAGRSPVIAGSSADFSAPADGRAWGTRSSESRSRRGLDAQTVSFALASSQEFDGAVSLQPPNVHLTLHSDAVPQGTLWYVQRVNISDDLPAGVTHYHEVWADLQKYGLKTGFAQNAVTICNLINDLQILFTCKPSEAQDGYIVYSLEGVEKSQFTASHATDSPNGSVRPATMLCDPTPRRVSVPVVGKHNATVASNGPGTVTTMRGAAVR